MLLRRFYDNKLAQASYLVGCQATGEALIIDPNRDVEQYLAAVKAERMRLAYVTETHIHADFVSGTRELAARAGARLLLSDEGGADWRYGFAASDQATLMKDGHTFKVGNIIVKALHTPGHTPEHLSYMITDGAATDRPMGVFTGDFVFVGDVGRPDLLEKAAGVRGTMEAGAKQLFQSLQRFKKLPDYLQLWPGHGAGSACGKSLGAVPSSTLGYERFANWALATEHEGDFIALVLAGQPDPPKYFAQMKRINRDGPKVLGSLRPPAALPPQRLRDAVAAGSTVVDTRAARVFAQQHMPGTINIPLNNSFTTYAGWVLSYDEPFYLIAESIERAREAGRDLMMIGLDSVVGWFGLEAVADARGTIPEVTIEDAAHHLEAGDAMVVDVRWNDEWNAGHLPGARHMPMGHIREHLENVPRETPLVLHCQSGSRSAIAASVAKQMGFEDVRNYRGGWTEWKQSGRSVEQTIER